MYHLEVRNRLGEGVIWDALNRLLWWTDILDNKIYCFNDETHSISCWQTPERLCSFALYQPANYRFIAAFESGFAVYTPKKYQNQWLVRPQLAPHVRFNDGRVDRQGRFWAGSMGEGISGKENLGALFCLQTKTEAAIKLEGIGISNSLCWSPDGRTLYFADSLAHRIDAYAFDPASGQLGARRDFVHLPAHIYPDGAAVDVDGYLWSAQWGGSRVVRYAPDGREDRVLELPVSQPTCVAFGGDELRTLFITSARDGLSAAQLEQEPLAGTVLAFEMQDVQGLPEVLARY